MSGYGDNLWHNTLGYGATAPARSYLTDAENCRMERIRIARMLWKGRHRNAYLHEARTQFDFPEMTIQGRLCRPYITFNMLRLISTTLTDLLLGEAPLLRADKSLGGGNLTQQAIQALVKRSDLNRVFMDASRNASWAAEAMVEIVRWDGQVYIQDVKSDELFPQGERQPDGQYPSYIRYAIRREVKIPDRGTKNLLLRTIYQPGRISRSCHLIDGGRNAQIGDVVDLSLWPIKRPDGSPLSAEEDTGIPWNTIVWVGNELDEGEPTSDYDGLIELQDELNSKQTQIARVIAKHADPKLAMPEFIASDDGALASDQNLFFFRNKDEIPSYITWNAELASAIADRDFVLQAISIASEIPLGLLGLDKGAAPDSARKLRLQATKALSRTKRKVSSMQPFIQTSLDTALMLMNVSSRTQVAMPIEIVDGQERMTGGAATVELRDGLPVDELDQAQVIGMLTGGKPTMSVERGVRIQIPDVDEADQEIERLNEAAANATPSVFFNDAQTGATE